MLLKAACHVTSEQLRVTLSFTNEESFPLAVRVLEEPIPSTAEPAAGWKAHPALTELSGGRL